MSKEERDGRGTESDSAHGFAPKPSFSRSGDTRLGTLRFKQFLKWHLFIFFLFFLQKIAGSPSPPPTCLDTYHSGGATSTRLSGRSSLATYPTHPVSRRPRGNSHHLRRQFLSDALPGSLWWKKSAYWRPSQSYQVDVVFFSRKNCQDVSAFGSFC